MLRRIKQKILITPKDVSPTREDLEVVGVFNPAAIRVNGKIYLLARIAEGSRKKKEGHLMSPRWVFENENAYLEIDPVKIAKDSGNDPRKCAGKSSYLVRLSFVSHLRLVKLDSSGFEVQSIDDKPTFFPEHPFEEYGVEDPRLTKIDGRYYFTYVTVSSTMGVATALASTIDFVNYERHGIIFCQENKDVVILPGKTNGRFCAYHRPVPGNRHASPDMHAAFSPDLLYWGDHRYLMGTRKDKWDSHKIGGGTVPVRTDRGWLEIYHGVSIPQPGKAIGTYRAGAALFDLDDPTRLIARSEEPILEPSTDSEKTGFIENVIFPTGAVMDEDGKHLLIYSGAADTVITVIKLSLKEIFESMEIVG